MNDPRLTDKELDELARSLPLVKAWVAAVEAEILARLTAGSTDFTNVVLVPKRATRRWKDQKDAIAFLLTQDPDIEAVAPREPLSPSEAEKKFGKAVRAAFSSLAVSESSGMTIKYRD